ncbi:molybdopterin molybdotransferase MoeA [Marinactinospora rubrisoli]|uniref:Molybdopterin molybdenumtransferase n=1 Tax=Marinactinospora rubrisoli TaxID=2715399 RepID=A0ABW2KCX5_9ACTN
MSLATAHAVPVRRRAMTWSRAREAARELATAHLASGARDAPVTHLPLAEAPGAALAAAVTARVAVPGTDTAAMDGYAVAGRGPWRVVGRVLAGRPNRVDRLRPAEAVEIATGAPVPAGTVAVLPYERAERAGDRVAGPAVPGRHVRRRGETVPRGAVLAPAGTVVTPALLGLAAGTGHDELPVRRPRVAALVTGDEVLPAGLPVPGAVRDAIGPMLPGVVRWAGGVLAHSAYVGDGRAGLVAELRAAAADPWTEVVAVCGASSAGPADHLRDALDALGADIRIAGVACRPGHPQVLAVLPGGPLVVGLPGNPNAALVAALTLLVPALAALAGRPDPAHAGRHARLAAQVDRHPADTRLVAVRVRDGHAVPVGGDGPAALRGVAVADALAVLPPGDTAGPVELLELPR